MPRSQKNGANFEKKLKAALSKVKYANKYFDFYSPLEKPVMAFDALVPLGLLDDDYLVDAAIAGSSDGTDIEDLRE